MIFFWSFFLVVRYESTANLLLNQVISCLLLLVPPRGGSHVCLFFVPRHSNIPNQTVVTVRTLYSGKEYWYVLYVCLSFHLSINLSVCLSIILPVYQSIYTFLTFACLLNLSIFFCLSVCILIYLCLYI